MAHYFSKEQKDVKSNPKMIAFRALNNDIVCHSDHGVFAKDGLDRGTAVLLEYLTIDESTKTVLDLGCGYGTIGIAIAKANNVSVDMIDINERAIELAKQNVEANRVHADVFYSDGFEHVNSSYDLIITNPPIRIGKKAMYQLFKDAKNHINEQGKLLLVINKKHGAESAVRYLETLYKNIMILGRKKGFYVVECKK